MEWIFLLHIILDATFKKVSDIKFTKLNLIIKVRQIILKIKIMEHMKEVNIYPYQD